MNMNDIFINAILSDAAYARGLKDGLTGNPPNLAAPEFSMVCLPSIYAASVHSSFASFSSHVVGASRFGGQ
ncbi:hypothetical protein [Massilia genomosp. 1]|uniref:Uncharacterized protein n=1 Tax=Massilia genomosp. 1 TaxID=2609280 RepID=A0ABX0MSF0_9BURK|nr:hypothetical protein [Massilia genomosp. 1]NHZ65670.1 hypothetical protein [Massilia genomosp. 1]